VDIEKVEKVVKKKRTKFPEKLIYEIAEAAERHELNDKELDELVRKLRRQINVQV